MCRRGSALIKGLSVTLLLAVVAFGLFVFFDSAQAEASVLSFLADAITGKEASGNSNESKYNSQNIALLSAPLSPKLAIGGSVAIVDNSALEYQAESSVEAYQSDQISVYVVHEGDTLSQIAKMFNVSINTIVWANDIENGVIVPGQNLVILPISGIRHIVKSGDTIQSIAQKYDGDLKEILQYNNLSAETKLAVGDEIIIPNADASPAKLSTATQVKAPTRQVSTGYFIRPVKGGVKTQGIHGYNAVDIGVPIGTRVTASAAGKVIVSRNSGYNGGYGNYIVISHPNGTQTLYAHLNSTAIAQGSNVEQGQLIGYSGTTGRSTGPHLHFEVRGAKNPF